MSDHAKTWRCHVAASMGKSTGTLNCGGPAAHISPIEHRSLDSVRDGIALSGTGHWMFDRGLILIGVEYGLLVAEDHLPDTATRLLNPDGKLRLPSRPDLLPQPKFLEYHRRKFFNG